jgi:hypothetical protein
MVSFQLPGRSKTPWLRFRLTHLNTVQGHTVPSMLVSLTIGRLPLP